MHVTREHKLHAAVRAEERVHGVRIEMEKTAVDLRLLSARVPLAAHHGGDRDDRNVRDDDGGQRVLREVGLEPRKLLGIQARGVAALVVRIGLDRGKHDEVPAVPVEAAPAGGELELGERAGVAEVGFVARELRLRAAPTEDVVVAEAVLDGDGAVIGEELVEERPLAVDLRALRLEGVHDQVAARQDHLDAVGLRCLEGFLHPGRAVAVGRDVGVCEVGEAERAIDAARGSFRRMRTADRDSHRGAEGGKSREGRERATVEVLHRRSLHRGGRGRRPRAPRRRGLAQTAPNPRVFGGNRGFLPALAPSR